MQCMSIYLEEVHYKSNLFSFIAWCKISAELSWEGDRGLCNIKTAFQVEWFPL